MRTVEIAKSWIILPEVIQNERHAQESDIQHTSRALRGLCRPLSRGTNACEKYCCGCRGVCGKPKL